MTTWTCKGAFAAFALVSLGACDALPDLGTLTASQPDGALSQANMAFGEVTLVPPNGFCIDRASLKQNFALMAPCEVLGAAQAGAGAPSGILTASFSTAGESIPTPAQTAVALKLDAVNDPITQTAGVTYRAIGDTPADGLSATHWRATAVVGSQTMGLALFGRANGRATSAEGRAILTDLIKSLQNGS